MRAKNLVFVALGIAVAALVSAAVGPMAAQSPSVALTGVVSAQEGAAVPSRAGAAGMEGVLVSAKRAGSTITVTVVSDAAGPLQLPARPAASLARTRFAFGRVGYELEGPGTVDVTAQQTAQLDLALRKTQDLASQLSNGEWFMSWPGSDEMKNGLLNCTQCHGLAADRPVPVHRAASSCRSSSAWAATRRAARRRVRSCARTRMAAAP